MSDQFLRRGVLVLYACIVVLSVLGFLLKGGVTSDDVFGIPFFAFATVGAVVATRHPGNPVGWVFLIVGLAPTIGFFSGAYAAQGFGGGDLPATRMVLWVSSWAWFPGVGTLITFGLLLFPDGRLPSRRWRGLSYAAGGLILLITALMAVKPGPIEPFDPTLPTSPNPLGIESARGLISTAEGIGFSLFPLFGLLCALSLAFRYRRASPQQRQQIKWFAYSAVMLVVIMLFERVFESVLGPRPAELAFLVGMILPSLGAGIGILKYRLYDIDVVINRTLVYVAVTALLALVYLGGVIVMQRALGDLVRDSDVAVAASTLAVAGLFRPVRARTQGFIDQRFYRRKYDARQTLESFSSRLREKVDLESLNKELTEVVGQTMQPAHLSLWIRTSEVTR